MKCESAPLWITKMDQRSLASRSVGKAMVMQESLVTQRGGSRGRYTAQTTSSLQSLIKLLCMWMYLEIVTSVMAAWSSLYVPTLLLLHIYTDSQTILHPFPLDWAHGMGSGLRGNEVTHTHPHTCKNTPTVIWASVLLCSVCQSWGYLSLPPPPAFSKPQPTF